MIGQSGMRFRPTETVAIVAATVACFGAIISALIPAFYTYASCNKELDVRLVEIGIGILRADPKETQTEGAREWAIRVIETHSGQLFTEDAKSQLLNNKLGYDTYDYNLGSYTKGNFSSPGGFGDTGHLPRSP